MAPVRTRFAPSPTGFIHLGNVRSALYPWAFARSQQGTFILRIEDTDIERSSQEAIDVILDSMQWLGLSHDEGPIYQTQRMARYQAVLAHMLEAGLAYPCYMPAADLDALREAQMARKEKPRYDGTWRPESGKRLPDRPEGVKPVLRFRNPEHGVVAWEDKVKGRIEVHNAELDDLIIARADGTPTYNFCVVVDDMDMAITHVIRGDDHVNNTPRQINIFRALGHEPPVYAHLPTVLNERGEKMSKRQGAKAVTQYRDEGYLPDAVVNYLARLGWSHGDDEIFSRSQLIAWFDLEHLGRSAGQFDEAKLRWVNAQHLRAMDNHSLAELVAPHVMKRAPHCPSHPEHFMAQLSPMCGVFKDRCSTLLELADWLIMYFVEVHPPAELVKQHVTPAVRDALVTLSASLALLETWSAESIHQALKATLMQHHLKMPQLAIPLRVLLCARTQTPSVDAVLALFPQEKLLGRLRRVCESL